MTRSCGNSDGRCAQVQTHAATSSICRVRPSRAVGQGRARAVIAQRLPHPGGACGRADALPQEIRWREPVTLSLRFAMSATSYLRPRKDCGIALAHRFRQGDETAPPGPDRGTSIEEIQEVIAINPDAASFQTKKQMDGMVLEISPRFSFSRRTIASPEGSLPVTAARQHREHPARPRAGWTSTFRGSGAAAKRSPHREDVYPYQASADRPRPWAAAKHRHQAVQKASGGRICGGARRSRGIQHPRSGRMAAFTAGATRRHGHTGP